jgi:uncharacterized protein (TIGR02001 family)
MSKFRIVRMLALTLLGVAPAPVALAADPLIAPEGVPGKFTGTVTFTNEYYYRGLSQTDDAPAIQGSLDYSADLVKDVVAAYLGVWGSNVDFNEASGIDGATVEMDWYGGLKGMIGSTGLSWDTGFIYYWYPGADSSLNYDFVEAKFALGYDFGFLSVTGSYNWSPDFFAASGTAHYPKLAINVPVMGKVDLGAYIARQYIENNARYGSPDYTEYNLSAKINVAGFDLSIAYTDTSIDGDIDGKGAAVLFAVGRTF